MAKPRAKVRASTKSTVRPVSKTKTKTLTKAKTRSKTRSKTKTKAKTQTLKPHNYYFSQESTFTSNPEHGEPYGKITTVDMRNNKGEKSVQILNKEGKPVKTSKTPLKKIQMPNIQPLRIRVPIHRFGFPGLFGAFGF